MNFYVVLAANETLYGEGDDMKLNKSGPIALFSDFKLPGSNGKPLESIDQTYVVSST